MHKQRRHGTVPDRVIYRVAIVNRARLVGEFAYRKREPRRELLGARQPGWSNACHQFANADAAIEAARDYVARCTPRSAVEAEIERVVMVMKGDPMHGLSGYFPADGARVVAVVALDRDLLEKLRQYDEVRPAVVVHRE